MSWFDGFRTDRFAVNGTEIFARMGGTLFVAMAGIHQLWTADLASGRVRAHSGSRASVALTRSPVSSSQPSMCRRAGPSSVQRSRKKDQPSSSGSSERVITSTR